jgi:hypothetical protein
MIDLTRKIRIDVCKDGTVTYVPRGEPPFNGAALPVHSVDTVEEAQQIQVTLCRCQYVEHPLMPGKPWYKLTQFDGGIEGLEAVGRQMQSMRSTK